MGEGAREGTEGERCGEDRKCVCGKRRAGEIKKRANTPCTNVSGVYCWGAIGPLRTCGHRHGGSLNVWE